MDLRVVPAGGTVEVTIILGKGPFVNRSSISSINGMYEFNPTNPSILVIFLKAKSLKKKTEA